MRRVTRVIIAVAFIICCCQVQAQYILNGNATQNSCNCYTLTQPINSQFGSVWNSNKISLNNPFDFVFNVYLGCLDANGADGIVFILQPISTSIGTVGGGMGFQGISPSVGIALDTWQNFEFNDPAFDHLSIQVNGDINHLDDVVPLVQASASSANIEDCQWHTFRIKWDPATHLIQTFFDGVFRQQATIDLVTTIFNNNPMVYWGFSGATGGAVNLQQFCTALNPDFSFAEANTISCDSSAVTFTSTSQSFAPIASYYWNFGDGTTSSSATPPVHHYAAPGSYPIKLVISGMDGCVSDTLRRTITLAGQPVTSINNNVVICEGSSYTLPWGPTVNTSGIYRDTLRYATGCDSIRTTVNLIVRSVTSTISSVVLCGAQSYTLPWGTAVNTSGVYRDTLRYASGCDSLRRTINLTIQPLTTITLNPAICPGGSYTLPWGPTVATAGTYADTSRYSTGCDSVIQTVNLRVISLAASVVNAVICAGENYTLPWGAITGIAGLYQDTLRAVTGCDSLIRVVNLIVNPAPVVSIKKSNDVDCMLGIAKLEATGGINYLWSPAASLNNPNVRNPIAAPPADTWYHVIVSSDKGCTVEDSIEVKLASNIENGYPVPTAFTPNGDGRNDCFGLEPWGYVTEFNLSIFNRWGQLLFHTNKISGCWDGTFKGIKQTTGIYIYEISGKGVCGKILRKGTFALIR